MAEEERTEAMGSGENGAAMKRAAEQQARAARMERFKSSGDSSLQGVVIHKVCCVCSAILNHKPRFKDHEGRYWCPRCNREDHEKVRPAPCADCGIEMPRADMREVGTLLLCPVCVTKVMKEGRAVAEVRLRALAHGKQDSTAVERTAAKVKTSRKGGNKGLFAAMVLVVVLAIIAILVIALR